MGAYIPQEVPLVAAVVVNTAADLVGAVAFVEHIAALSVASVVALWLCSKAALVVNRDFDAIEHLEVVAYLQ